MKHRVICINREHGTNGKALAEMVADQLGIRCYGRVLLNAAILNGDLKTSADVETFLNADEAFRKETCYKLKANGTDAYTKTGLPDDTVFELSSALLKGLAQQEDFVVYGLCGTEVLADEDAEVLKVFVTAPEEYCVDRIMQATNRSKMEAKMRVGAVNRKRREYFYSNTGKQWNETDNYDLVINMEQLGVHKAKDLLCAYYNDVMPAHIAIAETAEDIKK